jgi:hypothetical protein
MRVKVKWRDAHLSWRVTHCLQRRRRFLRFALSCRLDNFFSPAKIFSRRDGF